MSSTQRLRPPDHSPSRESTKSAGEATTAEIERPKSALGGTKFKGKLSSLKWMEGGEGEAEWILSHRLRAALVCVHGYSGPDLTQPDSSNFPSKLADDLLHLFPGHSHDQYWKSSSIVALDYPYAEESGLELSFDTIAHVASTTASSTSTTPTDTTSPLLPEIYNPYHLISANASDASESLHESNAEQSPYVHYPPFPFGGVYPPPYGPQEGYTFPPPTSSSNDAFSSFPPPSLFQHSSSPMSADVPLRMIDIPPHSALAYSLPQFSAPPPATLYHSISFPDLPLQQHLQHHLLPSAPFAFQDFSLHQFPSQSAPHPTCPAMVDNANGEKHPCGEEFFCSLSPCGCGVCRFHLAEIVTHAIVIDDDEQGGVGKRKQVFECVACHTRSHMVSPLPEKAPTYSAEAESTSRPHSPVPFKLESPAGRRSRVLQKRMSGEFLSLGAGGGGKTMERIAEDKVDEGQGTFGMHLPKKKPSASGSFGFNQSSSSDSISMPDYTLARPNYVFPLPPSPLPNVSHVLASLTSPFQPTAPPFHPHNPLPIPSQSSQPTQLHHGAPLPPQAVSFRASGHAPASSHTYSHRARAVSSPARANDFHPLQPFPPISPTAAKRHSPIHQRMSTPGSPVAFRSMSIGGGSFQMTSGEIGWQKWHDPRAPRTDPSEPYQLEPNKWPVIKVENIPFNTTVLDLEKWLPPCCLPHKDNLINAIHIILHRVNGRTLPHCYLETNSSEMALEVITKKDRAQLGDRTVRMKWERRGELMRDAHSSPGSQLFSQSEYFTLETRNPASAPLP
ncbi:hypothetical protein P7C70_g5854, partial [Phenoliferia sp. Uapishka_3]